jgi:2-haloacid dehalogenase
MAVRFVLFDLNATLVDPAVLAGPLGGRAEDEALVNAAFDEAVMQAMVSTLTGWPTPFAQMIEAALRRRLVLGGRDEALAGAAIGLLGSMPAYTDAPAALEALRGVGVRIGVLTQSTAEAADAVLRFAGLRDRVELVLSAPDAGAYKPDPRPYRMALSRTGAAAGEVCLVAAHWWDVAGAKRAGLRTGWVARRDRALPATVPTPDVTGAELADVSAAIVARLT